VRDVERSFRFYRRIFGMVAVHRAAGWIQAQTPGSRDVLVLVEEAPRARARGGVAHFGFRLVRPDDIDAAARAVERAGGRIVEKGAFCPGEPYLFFSDPDGYTVEIWYELPTVVDPPRPRDSSRARDRAKRS
jgi:catechol 2,3-dioxygenase-like lactoylglutathione lyase family enzyme